MSNHSVISDLGRWKDSGKVSTPLLRQWRLLELLSADSVPATVYELASRMGVSDKTIRRDLVLFSRLGLNLDATEDRFGRRYWRIRPKFSTLRGKRRQYRSLRDSVAVLIEQAQSIGDKRLAADLEAVRRKVQRKTK